MVVSTPKYVSRFYVTMDVAYRMDIFQSANDILRDSCYVLGWLVGRTRRVCQVVDQGHVAEFRLYGDLTEGFRRGRVGWEIPSNVGLQTFSIELNIATIVLCLCPAKEEAQDVIRP